VPPRSLLGAGLIFHSDRGSQYESDATQGLLAEHGMLCSMSRRGFAPLAITVSIALDDGDFMCVSMPTRSG
jgi:hypothetical protein